jgi:hypothetical protein
MDGKIGKQEKLVQNLVKPYLEITTGGKIGQRNFERGLLARKDEKGWHRCRV